METSIELRYAGVVIGKATAVGDINGDSLFLAVADPLPVGTRVGLKVDERKLEGRVVGVTESSDLARCGMTVKLGAASANPVTAPPAPAPPAAAPAPPAVAAPAVAAAAAVVAPSEAPAALEEVGADGGGAQADVASDGVPVAEESSGPSGGGGGGGGRRRRRKR